MKNHLLLFASMIFTISSLRAQNIEPQDKTLTQMHTKIMAHAESILNSAAKPKEERIKYAEDLYNNLQEAKKSHAEIKKAISAGKSAVASPYLLSIETYHIQAEEQSKVLNEELKKTPVIEARVSESAKKLHESIDKAEKEHQKMKEKLKN